MNSPDQNSVADPAAARDAMAVAPEARATLRLLIVDDDRTLREGCASILQGDGYNVTVTGRADEAMELVKRRRFDIVLCDLYLTPVSGMEILKAALEANKETIFVVMTGNPSVTSSIEALRAGAWDYLPKPFSASHLQILVGRASHAVLVSRETRAARSEGGSTPGPPSGAGASFQNAHTGDRITLLGQSPAFRRALDLSRKVAGTDASVLISGESGTGKELIAQFIHSHSRRAGKKLVAVNCAALPEQLLESEMFGHKKGAFTGADRDKAGLLEVANGGTLFLDELTEMSMPLQAKLLRVLQDGVVRRVGSETQDAVVDVRFISAMNRDPLEAVAQGRLREDLYYRLRVVPIRLPPLRQRPEDISVLAQHFLHHFWDRHRQPGEPSPTFSEDALDFLRSRPWRGNVRELQNMIEHTAVVADPGTALVGSDFPVYDDAPEAGVSGGDATTFSGSYMNDAYHVAKDKLVAQFEKEYLTRLVSRAGGNMSRAARLAGIDRTTLYRLMEKHELRRDEYSGSLA
ncbi:MAG: sigma-54-dependent Fis family transcriptional regulator [Gemmatimonadaceae bacterium]|nr:sigma-54-dependent Fis family transcriptional regulator [Gemmatimonadaceae bacterium]